MFKIAVLVVLIFALRMGFIMLSLLGSLLGQQRCSWRLLAAPGGCWQRLLAAPGGSWRLLAAQPAMSREEPPGAAGAARNRQEPPGATRSRQEPPGAARTRQEPPGAARSRQEPPGAARRRQEPPGGKNGCKPVLPRSLLTASSQLMRSRRGYGTAGEVIQGEVRCFLRRR